MTQAAPQRVGVLEMASPDADRLALWALFKNRLGDLGYADGDRVAFEFRWAEGRQERLADAASELVRLGVDVLVTAGTPAAAAASRATQHIPIVMATGVGLGTALTEGATAPNPNVTGISDLPPGISEKRLRLLREAVPGDAPLALLADRANPSSLLAWQETQAAARALGIEVRDYWVRSFDEFGDALEHMTRDSVGGFVVAPGAMFFAQRSKLAALAIAQKLPTMSVRREYCEAGCLIAYGAPIRENYRQAAVYVSRILQGTHPADLPVDQPTDFDFVINMKTAASLGLSLPVSLLSRAEQIGLPPAD